MPKSLPRGVVALGLVSLFMDISSEMIHALLPLFLTGTLGASALWVGVIEGVGEATASFVKPVSGILSDRTGRRKPLAIAGYGLSAVTKPLFALAGIPAAILVARFADRVGKGIRGAPRDALIADMVPPEQHGAAYGLRQSLDTIGAFAGPALAILLMGLFAGDMRAVFAVAIVPAILSVATLALFVREERPATAHHDRPGRATWQGAAALGRPFFVVVAFATVLTFARFSDAFLILRANDAGLGAAQAPLVLVAMNVAYALSAWPAGHLSDRIGARGLLAAGVGLLVLADLLLRLGGGVVPVMAGVVAWGLHMGLTQGLLSAEIAGAAPHGRRGTAFGVFGLLTGAATLAGNLVAGALWAGGGAPATFGLGMACAGLCLPGVLLLPRARPAA